MKCTNCGEVFDDKFRFCPGCGTSVSVISGVSGVSGVERSEVGGQRSGEDSIGGMRTVVGEEVQGSGETVQGSRFRVQGSGDGVQGSGFKVQGSGDDSIGGMRTMVGAEVQGSGERVQGSGDGVQGSGDGVQGSGFKVEGSELRTRYEILEEIGRGGFARVWKARDLKLDRFVAVKRLVEPAVKDANREQTVQRFRREARAIAGLNHRNIVGVYDVGEDGEGDYIVMELVEGLSLRGYVKEKGKLDEAEAVTLVKGIAQGLGYAHKKNLVHRDVKPANVLLLKEGDELVPKIVDFGLARVGTDSELSMTGYGMGTPWYMPPEQRRDAKGVNHTADIYALGKTLYELLTGEIPDNVDPEAVSPRMAKVIIRCVKSNPEDRYFSAEEMVAELQEASKGMVRRVSADAVGNSCPSCGAVNPEDAKFCDACGTGLTRPCPECGRENSVNKTFCGGCGTDVEGFLKLEDVAGRMQRYAKDKKWSRVKKEYRLLPDPGRLSGEKARKLFEQSEAAGKLAPAMLSKRDALNQEVNRCMDAGDFEKAVELVAESLSVDPYQEDLKTLEAEELPARIDEQKKQRRQAKWKALQKDVAELEDEGYLVEAVEKLRAFGAQYPETPEAEAAQAESERLGRVGVDGLCRQFDEAVQENNFEEALAFLTAAEEIAPGDPEVIRQRGCIDQKREKLEQLMNTAGRVQEIDQILREWPGFPGALEKRGVILQKAVREKYKQRAIFLVEGVIAFVVGVFLIQALHSSRMANRHVKLAIEAKERGDWESVHRESQRALGVKPAHGHALQLEQEAREALKPVLVIETYLEGQSIPAQIWAGETSGTSPHRVEIKDAGAIEIRARHTVGRDVYTANYAARDINWKGVREHRLELIRQSGAVRVTLEVPAYAREFFRTSEVELRVGSETRKASGQAEWTLEGLPVGEVEVRVQGLGFTEGRGQRVEVRDGERAEVRFVLEPLPARVTVTGAPSGASVRLPDGSSVSAGSEIAVPSLQAVTLHVSAPRHQEAVVQVPVLRPGERRSLVVRMEEIKDPTAGNVLGMRFVEVEPGSFRMGNVSGVDNDEGPVREVRITRGFWMGVYEVTQREYEALMGNNPSHFKGDANRPVERVSWNAAVAFCVRLTERERAAGRLPAGYVYRLPTEAEWEYAARGGAKSRGFNYAGSNNVDEVAWHSGNSGNQTRPVGGKRANELGLHDMSGNVWEWVHDWYQNSYQGLGAVDPTGPANGSGRVIRGGCWLIAPSGCRVSSRDYWFPTFTYYNLGFRVVLAPQFR